MSKTKFVSWLRVGLCILAAGCVGECYASTTTITIGGSEQFASPSIWDSGAFSLTVNGHTESVSYGQFSTPQSVASGLAAVFSSDCTSPVIAHANGAVITFSTKLANESIAPISAASSWNTASFTQGSFYLRSPIMTWALPAAITYGTALSAGQLDATASVPGTFVYSPSAGTVLAAGLDTLSVTFTPTDTIDYATTTSSVTLSVNQATPVITWVSPASITYGTALSAAQLDATASVPGTFTYSPATGTVLPVGQAVLQVAFTPEDAIDYTTAVGSTKLTVAPPWSLPAPGTISTLVGNGTGGYAGDNGLAGVAQLNSASGAAVDSEGNLYIADTGNNVVREVSASTGVIRTVAGNGTHGYAGDGAVATAASLNGPTGVALDPSGNLYISDSGNNTIREVNSSTGIISTVAGNGVGDAGYSGDGGSAVNAQLNSPNGIAVDSKGNLYIADSQNNVIRQVAAGTGIITTIAGNGSAGNTGDGVAATGAELSYPTGVAADQLGNLYVVDSGNLRIREVAAATGLITTVAGTGGFGYSGDGGVPTAAEFMFPSGIAIDGNGNLYVTDDDADVVREVNISAHTITTVAGNGTWGYSGDGGPATSAQMALDAIAGVAVDGAGNLYIADLDNNVIRGVGGVKQTPTVTLNAMPQLVSASSSLSVLTATVSSGGGTVVFSNDSGWVSSPVGLVSGTASLSLNAGAWGPGTYTIHASYSGDQLDTGASASAVVAVVSESASNPTLTWSTPAPIVYNTPLSPTQLDASSSVAGSFVYTPPVGTILPVGSNTLTALFVPEDASTYNPATIAVPLTVRSKPSGTGQGIISTIAGDGVIGYSGDGGPAVSAELITSASGFTVDAFGNIYVSDSSNNVVRMIAAGTGVITTVAGNGTAGYSGDGGPATSASLNAPNGLAVDLLGNIYIADTQNHAIREVRAQSGTIETIAGNGAAGFSGDGGPATGAQLYFPRSLSVDVIGDLYIADSGNNVIREIQAASGTIATVAGNTNPAYSGDGGAATQASLNAPTDVALDGNGNIYIADLGNNAIRVVYAAGSVPSISSPVPGSIYSIAGGTSAGYAGDGGAAASALLNGPWGVGVDAAGNVFVADSNNNRVRAIYSAGTVPGLSNPIPGSIYTVAGIGSAGYSGDGGPASNAALNAPTSVRIDPLGNIDVLDDGNNIVRGVAAAAKPVPNITWPTPPSIPYGTALSAIQLNATTAVTGKLSYDPPAGTVLPVGTQRLAMQFLPSDTSNNASVAATNTVTVVPAAPVLAWSAPAPIAPGTPLGATQLDATATVPGTFVYSPAAGTVLSNGLDALNVTFYPTDAVDYTTATATVNLSVQPLTPVLTWVPPSPILYGTALTANQLDATSSVPGTWTYNPGIGTALPLGISTVTATFTPTDAVRYTTATISVPITVQSSAGPFVQLGTAATSNGVTLSDPENTDWIVWGADGQTTSAIRDANGLLLSDFTPTNAAIIQADLYGSVAYNWTGGTPSASGTNVDAEMTTSGANAGFTLTAPADTTVKTLKLYVSVSGNAQLTATLSDGSVPPFMHLSAPAQENGNEVYSIDYRAGSAGQSLSVQWVALDSGSAVGLQAAVLQPHLPLVTLLSPQTGQVYSAAAGVPVNISAVQFDNSITSVSLRANGAPVASMTSAPFQTTWNAPPGHYVLQGQASDTVGLSNNSAAQVIDVIGSGGSLSATFGTANSPIDLTNEGTADWTFFSPSTWSTSEIDRKAGVLPLIGIPTALGSSYSFDYFDGPPGLFSFEDGTPDVQESGILGEEDFVGSSAGMQLTVAADIQQRTLRLYGAASGSVRMTAYLSDGSAPVITDTSLSNTYTDASQPFYAITYNAATPGQTLTIQIAGQGNDGGEIVLNAASLTGSSTPSAPVVSSITPAGGGTVGDVLSIAGQGFGAAQGTSTVTLGGVSAVATAWTGDTIQVIVPAGVQSGPVQVVTAGGVSNTNVQFTLAPTVTGLSPAQGTVGTVVTVTGANFGGSQGSGSILFNGVTAAPISWTENQISVAVPAGATTGHVTVTQGVSATSKPLFTILSGAAGSLAPLLAVHSENTPSQVTLSDQNNQDWVVWGSDGTTPAATSKAQAGLISAVFDPSPTSVGNPNGEGILYSWSGGAPVAAATKVNAGISISGAGASIQLTAPADTTVRTLKIYTAEAGNVILNASVSDGSTTPVTYTSPLPNDLGEKTYLIDYRAASAGQTITVELTSSTNWVYVEAAALSPHLPKIEIVSPENGQVFQAGSTLNLGIDAAQFDTNIASVELLANNSQLLSLQSPYVGSWSPSQGHYSLRANATDANGLLNVSKPVSIDVIGTGGSLTGTSSGVAAQAPIDLTAEGTADWVAFGDGIDSTTERKAGVAQQISDLRTLGDSPAVGGYRNSLPISFRDGTPLGQANSFEDGKTVWNGVTGGGLEFSVNADTTPRTLHVYVATQNTQGKLKAYLSDGSAPVYIDTSVESSVTQYEKDEEYTLDYRAASPGQELTVQWILDNIATSAASSDGGVQLIAATLEGTPLALSGPSVSEVTPVSGVIGSTVTITGNALGATQGDSTVTFNGVVALPTSWSDTQVQVPVPVGATTGNVVITTSAGATEPIFYTVLPNITSTSTTTAPAGATVTLFGTSFGSPVLYNGNYQEFVTVSSDDGTYANAAILNWSDTQIQFLMPQMTGSTGAVSVLTPGGASNSIKISFANASISGLAPASGPVGTQVVISGAGFGATQGQNIISFGGVPASVVSWSDTSINAIVPTLRAGPTSVGVAIVGVNTNRAAFTVVASAPVITWANPSPISYGTALSALQLNATASVPGTFTYNPGPGTLPVTGTDVLTATFIPSDSTTYQNATATVLLTVNPGKSGIEVPPPGMIDTIAGTGVSGYTGNGGLATLAELSQPYGIAMDASGDLFIADTGNNVIREVNAATGIINVVAGSGSPGYAGDNGLATLAQLNQPYGIAIDTSGNLYIADTGNNAVRMVNPSTGLITTIVGDGSGTAGYSGDGGPAVQARLSSPSDVAVDSVGNVYIADWMNSAVRELTVSNGVISTIAGDGSGKASYGGDGGPATTAQLNRPFGIGLDNHGDLYIADTFNNRIREVNLATGVISTVAGSGTGGYSGDNSAAINANLNAPLGVAADGSGNIFISDWQNQGVREVSASGMITTVAGTGTPGFSNGGAADVSSSQNLIGTAVGSSLNSPAAIATDVNGNVFSADTGNNAIRAIGAPLGTPAFPVPPGQYLVWSEPTESTSSNSEVSNGTGSATFSDAGTTTFSAFSIPTLPPATTTGGITATPVLQGIYAVVAYNVTGMSTGATLTLTAGGQTFATITSNGKGVAYSSSFGTAPPGDITISLSGSASVNITSAALAYCYDFSFSESSSGGSGDGGGGGTITSGGGTPATQQITLVNPSFLPPTDVVNEGDVVHTSLNPKATVNGIVADGTSTAIAVYETNQAADVIFTVDNGFSLAPWDPNFRDNTPAPPSTSSPGTTTLVVPQSNLYFDGQNYYALALVQAGTPATSTVDAVTHVSGESGVFLGGSGSPVTDSVYSLPVPVVFVHGLWGDKTSLDSTRKYLASQPIFSSNHFGTSLFLQPICYSIYVRFDATEDPLPSGKCESTSSLSLDRYFQNLYLSMDDIGIVGGRVDAVVHSMGGLVLRNYAAHGVSFRSTTTRNAGVFRTIITLDSPETGSALADALDNVLANKTPASTKDNLWAYICGSDATETLRTCLQSLPQGLPLKHMPLAAPGYPLETGAVASLIPGDSKLISLPNPNLPDSSWFAVTAEFIESAANKSFLRYFLDSLISDLYPIGQAPLTTTEILGGVHNDSIVSVASQSYEALPNHTRLFEGMNHTGFPSWLCSLLTHFDCHSSNNTFVTDSSVVNQQVFGWLNYIPQLVPAPASIALTPSSHSEAALASTSQSSFQEAEQERPAIEPNFVEGVASPTRRLDADSDRVELPISEKLHAELGKPLELPIHIKGGNVVSIDIQTSNVAGALEGKRSGVRVGSGPAKIVDESPETEVAEVVPLQVGNVTVLVSVTFADGTIAQKTVMLNVAPPETGVTGFRLYGGDTVVGLYLTQKRSESEMWLEPEIDYQGLDYPIYLTDSSLVNLQVYQPEDPVIQLGSDGHIRALRAGEAVITGTFSGKETSLKVIVAGPGANTGDHGWFDGARWRQAADGLK